MTERLERGRRWFEEVYGRGTSDGLLEMQQGVQLVELGLDIPPATGRGA